MTDARASATKSTTNTRSNVKAKIEISGFDEADKVVPAVDAYLSASMAECEDRERTFSGYVFVMEAPTHYKPHHAIKYFKSQFDCDVKVTCYEHS